MSPFPRAHMTISVDIFVCYIWSREGLLLNGIKWVEARNAANNTQDTRTKRNYPVPNIIALWLESFDLKDEPMMSASEESIPFNVVTARVRSQPRKYISNLIMCVCVWGGIYCKGCRF